MAAETGMVLLAMTLFAAKHFVADFALQTGWMFRGKSIYGHPGGLAHAGVHMLGSLPALAVMGLAPVAILLVVMAEGGVHYHLDWAKERLAHSLGAGPQDRLFWLLIGADQFLHYLTYMAMILVALRFGG
jgi:hypothetical protein